MTTEPATPEPVFNPAARIAIRRMGREMHPLIVIDDVLLNAEDLRAYAISQAYSPPPEGAYYPGYNSPLPPTYGPRLTAMLRPLLERAFGLPQRQGLGHSGFFAIATTKAADLQPIQTIPHFDSVDMYKIACVHFLCGPPYRGTGFFRHTASGFETIDARRVEAYRARVFADIEAQGDAPGHVRHKSPFFEEIDYAEAVFNRLIAYRSTSLHAGILGETPLGQGPEDGRLTANSFIEVHRG